MVLGGLVAVLVLVVVLVEFVVVVVVVVVVAKPTISLGTMSIAMAMAVYAVCTVRSTAVVCLSTIILTCCRLVSLSSSRSKQHTC